MSGTLKPSRLAAVRNAKYAGSHTNTIAANADAVSALFDDLDDDIEAAVRPVAQAGSQVLYEAVQSNVRRLGSKTGNLAGSIYQAYSPETSGPRKANYHVSWRTSGAGIRAPHGHLLEFGYIQRYAVYIGRDGQWHTAVRPSMRGKKLPRNASQAQKDAYFVLRKGGPVQVPGKAFVRSAASRFPQALSTMNEKFFELMGAR